MSFLSKRLLGSEIVYFATCFVGIKQDLLSYYCFNTTINNGLRAAIFTADK